MLKKSKYYSVENLSGTFYLIPYGQAIVEQQAAYQLNETGVFIWNHIEECADLEHLFRTWARHEKIPYGELNHARQDLKDYLNYLKSRHLLTDDKPRTAPVADHTFFPEEPYYKTLCLAGLEIELQGSSLFFPKALDRFARSPLKSQKPAQTITVTLSQ
ncbi:MAG: PqqD family protein, partial [Bilifractor sp.]